jgi:hypothetical protein
MNNLLNLFDQSFKQVGEARGLVYDAMRSVGLARRSTKGAVEPRQRRVVAQLLSNAAGCWAAWISSHHHGTDDVPLGVTEMSGQLLNRSPAVSPEGDG